MEKISRGIVFKPEWVSFSNPHIFRLPVRWRLALVSLGLLTLLMSTFGILILFTAEEALLTNEAISLHNQANLAIKSLKGHPFTLLWFPGPQAASLPKNLNGSLSMLVERLASARNSVTILSPEGRIIINSTGVLTPPLVRLSPQQIQQQMNGNQSNYKYLVTSDMEGQRQLVILMPLVNHHRTVAILQLGTPTSMIDDFIATLRIILVLGVVGALSLAIALTFPLVDAALRPLKVMERTSRRIAAGELSTRLNVPMTNDEIGYLARSFNQMIVQLEAAFERQKQFVADVSHELRTPLTALSGSLEMVLLGADLGDVKAIRHLARGMYAEVKRMHRLVEDLLELTRMDRGRIVLRKEQIDLHQLIEKMYEQAQQLARGQQIKRFVEIPMPRVQGDADRLQQVILNIIDNALKFTPPGGLIELQAYREGETDAIISVRDSGCGIPADALPHIFDRFYRADASRSRMPQSTGGSGLGLAIAKELIEAQGGKIAIESTPGQGTTVVIRLKTVPLSDSPGDAALSSDLRSSTSIRHQPG